MRYIPFLFLLVLMALLVSSSCSLLKREPVRTSFCAIYHPQAKDPADMKTHLRCREIGADGKRVSINRPMTDLGDAKLFPNSVVVDTKYLEKTSQ